MAMNEIRRQPGGRGWKVGEKVFPTLRAASDFLRERARDTVRERLLDVLACQPNPRDFSHVADAIRAELSVKIRPAPKTPGANRRHYAKSASPNRVQKDNA
jgi:hypothetical protein